MKNRCLISTDGNREVLVFLNHVPSHGASGISPAGVRVSFLASEGMKFGKRNLHHFCSTEFENNVKNASKLTQKINGAFEKLSKTMCRHTVGSADGGSRGIALQPLALTATQMMQEFGDDEDYDIEFSEYRGLVLDLTYRPINVVCWRRALCLEMLEKADVLEYYDQVVNSPSKAFLIPAVLRITDYVHSPKRMKVKLSLSRKNVFLRDRFKCQYCSSRDNLTVDHVVPLSRGGRWSWDNLVTACSRCNLKKGDKTLEEANIRLIKAPKEPKELDTRELPANYAAYVALTGPKRMPNEWLSYVPTLPPQF